MNKRTAWLVLVLSWHLGCGSTGEDGAAGSAGSQGGTAGSSIGGAGGTAGVGGSGTGGTAGYSGSAGIGGAAATGGKAGTAGAAGAAGSAGSAASGGAAGGGGTAGAAGSAGGGGMAGVAGTAGMGGSAGVAGAGGTSGSAGTGGSTGPYGHVFYLNFNGAMVEYGATDATKNVSSLSVSGIDTAVPPYFEDGTVTPAHPTRESIIEHITSSVADLYAPFDVQVVTERPSGTPFTMIIIGGEGHDADVLYPNALGIADSMCSPYFSDRGIAHTFPMNFEGYGQISVDALASTVAHEAAHLWGLNHNTDPGSLMTPGLDILTWGAGPVDQVRCGHTYQDDAQMLLDHLGPHQARPPVPGPPDTEPPTVTEHTLSAGATLPYTFTPCVAVSDSSSIQFAMVQLWSDNGQPGDKPVRLYQQFLTTPPFVFPDVTYATGPYTTATLRLAVVDTWDNMTEHRATITTSPSAPAPPTCQ